MNLPGFKTLGIGDAGSGKTHAVRTLLRHGIQPLVLATEPGMRALSPCDNLACAICRDTRALPPIPWAYVPGSTANPEILIQQAEAINTRDLGALCKIIDPNRKDYDQFVQVLKLAMRDFVDFSGKSWGPVQKWGTDRCLVLDSGTELGFMAMNMFCGKRPAYDRPDYQIAQRAIYNFVQFLTAQVRCHVYFTWHPEREYNDATGGVRLTVSTVGQKLAPQLPRMFDDVFIAKRNGDKFEWSTAEVLSEGKGRNLPIKAGITPDFGQIVESWKRAGGKIEPTQETVK